MTILSEDDKTNGIATADPKMGLYPVAIVEGLKAEVARLKAMQPKETAAPERLKIEREWDIKYDLAPADLNRLDREGWNFDHFEFKGDKLNAVICRSKPAVVDPAPEKVAEVEPPKPELNFTSTVSQPVTIIGLDPEGETVKDAPVATLANSYTTYMDDSRARIQAAREYGFHTTLNFLTQRRALLPAFGGEPW